MYEYILSTSGVKQLYVAIICRVHNLQQQNDSSFRLICLYNDQCTVFFTAIVCSITFIHMQATDLNTIPVFFFFNGTQSAKKRGKCAHL